MFDIPLPPHTPIHMQEKVMCIVAAALKYELPANVLLAVAEQEGGRPGQWVRNTNGTYDVGYMQFNTSYIKKLAHYGITTTAVASPGCYSADLAAWRIKNHVVNDRNGDIWTRAANYHSYTPVYNQRYRSMLVIRGAKWGKWLTQNNQKLASLFKIEGV